MRAVFKGAMRSLLDNVAMAMLATGAALVATSAVELLRHAPAGTSHQYTIDVNDTFEGLTLVVHLPWSSTLEDVLRVRTMLRQPIETRFATHEMLSERTWTGRRLFVVCRQRKGICTHVRVRCTFDSLACVQNFVLALFARNV